jgi:LmbE family N-acetylglucosaminyl deacetylase
MITPSTYKNIACCLLSSCLLSLTAFSQAPKSYTSSEILLQLKKLNTVGSVLYIAAHPDDENTRLIAYLANEKCLRTGYLSLTRGDGGQNLIGPEQGIELGVIRTQELLAARRIDGGEQFFTRAYDFGFSKSPEETFTKWNKDSILGDMVWVIRNFRPDIIITRFATDGSGGHGHHTASAILAEEAFDAAADPTRFPEQLKYVEVWKTRRMFHNSTARFFNPNADLSHLLKLDVGVYNPLLGKSYGEIAAESRSMHKSQGFGSAKQRGESFEYFKPVKGDTTGLKDIFEGIDFTWKRHKGGKKMEETINSVIQKFNSTSPQNSVADLIALNSTIEDFIIKNQEIGKTVRFSELFDKIDELISNCSGLLAESLAKDFYVSQNDTIRINHYIINRSNVDYRFPQEQKLFGDSLNGQLLLTNKLYTTTTIKKEDTPNNKIYWLEKSIKNNRFNTDIIGYPELMGPNYERFEITSNNNNTVLQIKPIQYKWVDPEKGELYRPLIITPPVMVNMVGKAITFSNIQAKEIGVLVKAGKDNTNGTIKLEAPSNWKIEPALIAFQLLKKGEEKTMIFKITPPATASESMVTAVAEIDGERYTKGIKEIKYDHIPVQTLFPEAEAKLVKLDVVKKSKRIGYISGAGDEVQSCLSQLGYEVVTLTDDMLAKENLSQFDAIITGVRAYNTNDKLPSFKQKLMDYVAAGGNLIVQYNTNSWAGPLASDIGPYKFKITRDRITNEEAKVNLLLPEHPIFNTPNKITDKDFEGWVQERSIYHAGDWDSNYVAPISMADPNEKENKGALLIGKHGKGNFIYTGIVFFRELPAGVPGAYRLMVNLIELGRN